MDKKKEFLKKLCLVLIFIKQFAFLVRENGVLSGILV